MHFALYSVILNVSYNILHSSKSFSGFGKRNVYVMAAGVAKSRPTKSFMAFEFPIEDARLMARETIED